jgi:hypothetical protein
MFGLFSRLLLAIVALCVFGFSSNGQARGDEPASANRVFELRTYITNDGKMPELHKRFREHTNRLFEKHGMTLVGYWNPVGGENAENTLIYVLAFPSKEARDKSFAAFLADPEWQAAYKASHANGPLVKKVISQIMTPTDYSPLK